MGPIWATTCTFAWAAYMGPIWAANIHSEMGPIWAAYIRMSTPDTL